MTGDKAQSKCRKEVEMQKGEFELRTCSWMEIWHASAGSSLTDKSVQLIVLRQGQIIQMIDWKNTASEYLDLFYPFSCAIQLICETAIVQTCKRYALQCYAVPVSYSNRSILWIIRIFLHNERFNWGCRRHGKGTRVNEPSCDYSIRILSLIGIDTSLPQEFEIRSHTQRFG